MAVEIKYHQLALKNFETVLGQLAQNTKPQEDLASDTENLNQVITFTLRSGIDLIDRRPNKNHEVQPELVS